MFIFLGNVNILSFILFLAGELGDKWVVYCGSHGEICRGDSEEFSISDTFSLEEIKTDFERIY